MRLALRPVVLRDRKPPGRRRGNDAYIMCPQLRGEHTMNYRRFGKTGWNVSEIGYGMWGLAGWTGSDGSESRDSLPRAGDLGCHFFDTAWAYGDGRSEQILGQMLRDNAGGGPSPSKTLYTATKIPPKNRRWPSRRE